MCEIYEQDPEDDSCTKKNSNINTIVSSKNKYVMHYFLPGLEMEEDMEASAVKYNHFKDVFRGNVF